MNSTWIRKRKRQSFNSSRAQAQFGNSPTRHLRVRGINPNHRCKKVLPDNGHARVIGLSYNTNRETPVRMRNTTKVERGSYSTVDHVHTVFAV